MEPKKIPTEQTFDSTVAMLRDGYNFIKSRCIRHHSDIFQTRLMLKPVICLTGEEAAALFYNNKYFIRKGASPKRVQKTLFGEKGVQTLDDQAHRERKEMFMSLMGPEQLARLTTICRDHWQKAVLSWSRKEEVVMLEAANELMCSVACHWAGVPVQESEIPARAKEFGQMVDAFGGTGIRHRNGKLARKSSEKWIRNLITQIREKKLPVTPGTAAHTFALQPVGGKLLDLQVAAVELINILRPIVAIGTYITFAALALHMYPQYRKRIQSGDKRYTEWFSQEVRRFYPFTPFIGARVRETFEWNGYKFPKGRLVLLDVYGTDHDPRNWERPQDFWPERFRNWKQSPFDFIPQGGGDHYSGHRCAGEWVTIEALKVSVSFLASKMEYDVPEQDLTIDLSRMPTFPKSHFIIRNITVPKKVAQLV